MLKVESKYDERIDALHAVRVNVKSLAAEARMIRKETRRAGRAYKDGLALHRRGRLREEARYAHLALAFIRRRAYRQVEEKCFVPPDVNRLHKKVERFWRRVQLKEVVAWLN